MWVQRTGRNRIWMKEKRNRKKSKIEKNFCKKKKNKRIIELWTLLWWWLKIANRNREIHMHSKYNWIVVCAFAVLCTDFFRHKKKKKSRCNDNAKNNHKRNAAFWVWAARFLCISIIFILFFYKNIVHSVCLCWFKCVCCCCCNCCLSIETLFVAFWESGNRPSAKRMCITYKHWT